MKNERVFIMCNSNIYRMEIWEADFSHNYKSVICGKHPCIILSNFKTNVRSYGTVNVVPLTSNLVKYLNVHIDLKGYNLKEDSKALCNQIQTIDKSCLSFKIGKIDDIFTQLEIEKALESQMDLNKKQIDADSDELEDYFITNVKKLDDKVLCNKLKTEIHQCICDSKNEECTVLCDKLIELVHKSSIDTREEYLWYCYYNKALVFNRLQKYELALLNSKESLRFTGNLKDGISTKYGFTMWILAYTYEKSKLK
jgi:mRNA-degrading endonuclease toxin of MazEF toxin-antitoxin module